MEVVNVGKSEIWEFYIYSIRYLGCWVVVIYYLINYRNRRVLFLFEVGCILVNEFINRE